MKSFRQFVAEVAQPISQGEIDFLKKHVTVIVDYPVDVEDQFTGGDISKFTRLADYKPGQDAAVYESEIKLNGDEDINKAEQERHRKQEIQKKILDEGVDIEFVNAMEAKNLDADVMEECANLYLELSEEHKQFAKDNNIDLVDFLHDLSK